MEAPFASICCNFIVGRWSGSIAVPAMIAVTAADKVWLLTYRCKCSQQHAYIHMHSAAPSLQSIGRALLRHCTGICVILPCSNPDGTYSGTFSLKTGGFDDLKTPQDYEQLLRSRFAAIPDQWIPAIAEQTSKQHPSPAGVWEFIYSRSLPDQAIISHSIGCLRKAQPQYWLLQKAPCPCLPAQQSKQWRCAG